MLMLSDYWKHDEALGFWTHPKPPPSSLGEACVSLLEAVPLRLGLWRCPGPRNGKRRGLKRAKFQRSWSAVIREFGGCHPFPNY